LNLLLALFLCIASFGLDLNEEGIDLVCNKVELMVNKSHQANLNPIVVFSVIYHESRWKPEAVSGAGACGLTQIIPKWTGRMTGNINYTCNQLKDPVTSIKAGALALNYWINFRANGNLNRGLCGYNAGNRCLRSNFDGNSSYTLMVINTASSLETNWLKFKTKFLNLINFFKLIFNIKVN
jgi:hypothetical protein